MMVIFATLLNWNNEFQGKVEDWKMDLEEIWLEKRRCRYERRFLHILRSSCSKSRNLQRSDKMLKHAHLGYAASPHNVHQELSQDC